MPVINVWTTVSTCFIIMDHSTSRYFLNKWTYSRNDRSFTTVKYKHALIIEWLKFIVAQFWWKSLEHLHLQWSVITQGLHSSMLFFFQLGSWWAGESPGSRTIQLENTPEVQRWRDQNQTYTFPLKGRTIKVVSIIVSFSRCYL